MKKIFLIVVLTLLLQSLSYAQTDAGDNGGKKSRFTMSAGGFGFVSIPMDSYHKNFYDVGGGIGGAFKVNLLKYLALRTDARYNHNGGKTYSVNAGVVSAELKYGNYDVFEVRELILFNADTKLNEAGVNPYIGIGPVFSFGSYNGVGIGFIAGLNYNFANNIYMGVSLDINGYVGSQPNSGNDTFDIGFEVGYRF